MPQYLFHNTAAKMLSMQENSSLMGPAWYILQTLRVGNIIALLSVAISSMIMVIKTNIVTNFFVFQAISHTVTCGVALMLLVSELPQPRFVASFYQHNWPTFSTVDACNRGHSLAWLGAWMLGMGVWVLGSLNAIDLIADLSFPLWRLTLASGLLAIIFGVFNVMVSIIFRNSAHQITVRMIREHGANVYNVRHASVNYDLDRATLNSSVRSNSIRKEKPMQFHHPFPAAVNRLSNNRFSKLFMKKPVISGPIIQETQPDVEAQYPVEEPEVRGSWEATSPQTRRSPIAPHVQVSRTKAWLSSLPEEHLTDASSVQRPPTALHPAYGCGRSSIYSEASHINRF